MASSAGAAFVEEGDDDDENENEEMILPVTTQNIDPTVLASLPPSMQLDLLVQMRERVMAENRHKYQKIKKAPAKFSELQIQSYLKTVAFRREIDEVQRCAAGRGLGGVQTSKIASEANREFIYSSSFTGDKQMLTTQVANDGDVDCNATKKQSSSNLLKHNLCSNFISGKEGPASELIRDFGSDVETYRDESGHVRVSRVRALGIRMTRDIQRNLDFMKEYEQQESQGDISMVPGPNSSKEGLDLPEGPSESNDPPSAFKINEDYTETISKIHRASVLEDGNSLNELSSSGNKDTIEISFLEDQIEVKDADDQLFLHLVSGTPTSNLFSEGVHLDNNESNLFSEGVHLDSSKESDDFECLWEEGLVEEENGTAMDCQKESQSSSAEKNRYKDGVDWEEGVCDFTEVGSHCQSAPEKVSRGLLEEEALLQEAIRRSLEDLDGRMSESIRSEYVNLEKCHNDQSSLVFDSSNLKHTESRGKTCIPSETNTMTSMPFNIVDGIVQQTNSSRQDLLHAIELADPGGQNDQQMSQLASSDRQGVLCAAGSPRERFSSSNISDADLTADLSIVNEGRVHKSIVTSDANKETPPVSIDGELSEEQQLSITTRDAANNSSLRILAENNICFNFKLSSEIKSNAAEHTIVNAHSDQISEQSEPFQRRYVDNYQQKDIVKGNFVVNLDMQKEKLIKHDSDPSNPTIGKTTEHMDDHNGALEDTLEKEISLLRKEQLDLGDEQRKLERNADSVSSEMFAECQELLQMFGLPYIIAPMEAEAQCAYMEMKNLVDGVVTDDSDVLLFGARNVYKNIFDDRKYVETYFMKDIESELGLTREKLIRMALLLGSDYTEGISGIGIVNAIEVVHAFPEEDGLQKFREWVESPDPTILGKLDHHSGSNSKKRLLRSSNEMRSNMEGASEVSHDDEPSVSDIQDIKESFMSKHRNVSKNWHISSSFPSESVISAYILPQVDESTELFSWGKPDLVLLQKLCWETFGWNKQKADELLVPVLKEYNKHETQLRLEAFYTFNERFAKIRSQRIKKAVKGIIGNSSAGLADDIIQDCSQSRKKKCLSSSIQEKCSDEKTGNTTKATKTVQRGKRESKNIESDNGVGESLGGNGGTELNAAVGRVSGRRRVRSKGPGRDQGKPNLEIATSTDHFEDKDVEENDFTVTEAMAELRRSMRPRKQVKYAEVDWEEDYPNVNLNQNTQKELQQPELEQELAEKDSRDGSQCLEGSNYFHIGDGSFLKESDLQGHEIEQTTSSINDLAVKADGDGHREASGLDNGRGSPPMEFLKDYHFSGGGFCTDDGEGQDDTVVLPPAGPFEGSVELMKELQNVPDNDASLHPVRSPGGDDLMTTSEVLDRPNSSIANTYASQEGSTKHGLSAMPSLRRKRRKS
ncbi:DNA repair protein UVH3 isoform X2 [Typha latifolia]